MLCRRVSRLLRERLTRFPVEACYFRTSDQYEIDLVLDLGRSLWAIEVKLTSSPAPADMARLAKAADMIKADRRILISRTPEIVAAGRQVSCDLAWFLASLRKQG